MDSRLAKIEREIATFASRGHGRTSYRQTFVRVQSAIARFFKIAKQKVATAIRFCGDKSWAIAVSGRRLLKIAIRPAWLTGAYKPKVGTRDPRTVMSKERRVGRTSDRDVFLFSICFGLLCVCGIIIAALFLQIRDMKVEIAHWEQNLVATRTRLSQIEKIEREKITKEAKTLSTPPRHIPVTLSNDDMKAIRAFIKVLPSQPGSQQKIHAGEEIADSTAVPVPDSLVNQIPKLRGARFIVDENGAIIIIGEGSNRADAIIEPQ